MNVKIGTEAALFSEKEYINGIFVAGQSPVYFLRPCQRGLYRVRALQARAKGFRRTVQDCTVRFLLFIYTGFRVGHLAEA